MARFYLVFLACWPGLLWGQASPSQISTNEDVFATFEGDTWGDWQATGSAFGKGPASGTLPNQQPVTGFLGKGLASSYVDGDKSTGALTSPEFTIVRPYLNFLIGGGNHPGKACINLLIDGKVAYSATGSEMERLRWHTWQLFPVLKKKARIQIVDEVTNGWGHLNIDQITFTDRPRTLTYFNDAVTSAMNGLAEAVPKAERDPTRPIFHFLAPANWMNDPNGPIYYRDYYHIYYQHNPFGDKWGHMHWGHARSRDLVYWKHLPISLWPSKEFGEDHVFSGCATTNSNGEFLTFYTSIGRGKSAGDYAEQWAAIGDSDANTFKKHPANPVLGEKLHGDVKVYDWRDPFIFRDAGKIFMVCGGNLNQAKGGNAVVLLYEASNGELTDWKYRGILFKHPDPEVVNIECPNFFKLGSKWVLLVSPHRKVEYFTGAFDSAAARFTPEQRGLMDDSDDYYAPNCLEDHKGRRVLWGWVRGFKEDRGWNGCLTLARILEMGSDGHIRQAPPPELSKIRGQTFQFSDVEVHNATNVMQNVKGDAMELLAEIEPGDATRFGVNVRVSGDSTRSVPIAYENGALSVNGAKTKFSLRPAEKTLRLHVFLDKSVLEVYANGRTCYTKVVYPGEQDLGLSLFAAGGGMKVKSLQGWTMNTIWIGK